MPGIKSNLISYENNKGLHDFGIGKYWLLGNTYQNFSTKGTGAIGYKLVLPPILSVEKWNPGEIT